MMSGMHLHATALVGAGLLLGGTAVAEAPLQLRVATVATEGSPWMTGLVEICQRLEQNSKGKVRCRVFGGAVRGDEVAQMEAVRDGRLEAFGGSTGGAAGLIPELAALELPYLFRSDDEVDKVLAAVRPRLDAICERRGFFLAGLSEVGWRHIGSVRPLGPDALKGMRARSMENPHHADMWRRFGAEPVSLGITGVLPALEDGRVQAWDHAPSYAFGASWFGVAKHYTLTQHMYQGGLFLVGKGFWDRLPKPLRQHLFEGTVPIAETMKARIRALNAEVLGMLPQAGVKVVEPSPELRRALQERAGPVREHFRRTQGKAARELLEAIEQALGRLRG